MWTGAILAGTEENDPITGVIDWEFACLGRGVNGDMSQLMAHLHLFKLAAEGRGEELLLQGITSLIQSITSTYHEQSIKEAAKWMPGPVTPLNTLQATVMRSAFLAHGAEIVNCAFWKAWPCDDKGCGQPHPAERRDCRLIQRMIQVATWYLDRAGEDEAKFADTPNWDKLRDDPFITPLFRSS